MNDRLNQIRSQIEKLKQQQRELLKLKEELDNEQKNGQTMNWQEEAENKSQSKGTVNKRLTLSNGHSILDPNDRRNGFINMIIMALISGFGLGIVTTAIYIYINLGKITFTLN